MDYGFVSHLADSIQITRPFSFVGLYSLSHWHGSDAATWIAVRDIESQSVVPVANSLGTESLSLRVVIPQNQPKYSSNHLKTRKLIVLGEGTKVNMEKSEALEEEMSSIRRDYGGVAFENSKKVVVP